MTGRRRDPAASPDTLSDEQRSTSPPTQDRPPDAPDAEASTEGGEAAKKRARKRRAPFVL